MFNSLAEFYRSDLWRNFRANLIIERTNKADGLIYDEVTHKPILKAYDIVLHHIKPLTMENVNDFEVSLNPANIQIVSHRTHNEIHKRFGYTMSRKVYYVYGAPCSGKTTFVNSVKGNSDLIFDMDSVWQCLTHSKYEKPNALKTNAFIVRDCILDMVKTRAGRWERAYVIEGGANKADRERRISVLGAEPIFIDTDKDTCLERLHSDADRQQVVAQWENYIDDWFDTFEP